MMMVMLFTMTFGCFAEDNAAESVESAKKYELNVNCRRLACVLELSNDQMEMVSDVMHALDNDMVFASTMNSAESKEKVLGNAVKKNAKYMHYILNEEQYKKYMMLLNLTFSNRGLKIRYED